MRYDAIVADNDGMSVIPTDREPRRTASRLAFRGHGVHDPLEEPRPSCRPVSPQ